MGFAAPARNRAGATSQVKQTRLPKLPKAAFSAQGGRHQGRARRRLCRALCGRHGAAHCPALRPNPRRMWRSWIVRARPPLARPTRRNPLPSASERLFSGCAVGALPDLPARAILSWYPLAPCTTYAGIGSRPPQVFNSTLSPGFHRFTHGGAHAHTTATVDLACAMLSDVRVPLQDPNPIFGACCNPACVSGSHEAVWCRASACPHAANPHRAVEPSCASCREYSSEASRSGWRPPPDDVVTFLDLSGVRERVGRRRRRAEAGIRARTMSRVRLAARARPEPSGSPRACREVVTQSLRAIPIV